ncbi:hypothetical protein [Pelagicoccus mobilis]|uniref:Uncharacterized protein n=1 Tax=Pelagicoccus mobilis TaxID=415221 RepID=A0A934RUH3_9BACT|nr:hypothetical protein [Pelagicoccus mobilis]MBK1877082.1 hypothetical protein [Pelagicoccus mobilis]
MENSGDVFSFIMVMITIVIGFGVTELLSGSARLLRGRKDVRPYWLHIVVVIGVFLAHLVLWWEAWGLRDAPDWTFPGVLFMLTGPVGLYMIANLVFPDDWARCDFREYYYANARIIWIIAGIITLLTTLFRPIMFDGIILDADNLPSLIQLVIVLVVCIWNKPKVHAILIPIFFLIVLADQLMFRYFISEF